MDEIVTERLRRQQALARDRPPFLLAVMDEMALRRLTGGPVVMKDQLAWLLEAPIATATGPAVGERRRWRNRRSRISGSTQRVRTRGSLPGGCWRWRRSGRSRCDGT
ncbi:Scr1 family TA system antitoxin-like transcriptional regulator [Actinomadura sp. HBU206391]|uniref:Scr1 family TA system antitoxin-like transcriptional regulator n=1 Tax=Actinomadura sp. HBU206391 TaxID=2731692 RepID=UPI0039672358